MKLRQILLTLMAILLLFSTTTNAGIFRCRAQRGSTCQRWAPATPQAVQPVAPITREDGTPRTLTYPVAYETTSQSSGGDAYGFTAWINSVRARIGLSALRWSDNLASHAAINSSRGFGHSYMGGTRRQNVGVGALSTVEAMWIQSPGHWAAIADPTISEVGLAYVNGVWTMNAR